MEILFNIWIWLAYLNDTAYILYDYLDNNGNIISLWMLGVLIIYTALSYGFYMVGKKFSSQLVTQDFFYRKMYYGVWIHLMPIFWVGNILWNFLLGKYTHISFSEWFALHCIGLLLKIAYGMSFLFLEWGEEYTLWEAISITYIVVFPMVIGAIFYGLMVYKNKKYTV